jgi:putative serine protease PepD
MNCLPIRELLWRGSILIFLLLNVTDLSSALALTMEEENTISVYEKVAASVVNITTTSVEYSFFFLPYPTSGSGSGIILKKDGTIVTNYHVIHKAQRIEVTLADGSRWPAEHVGAAPLKDLAVIRIHVEGNPLKPIQLGNSDQLRVGHKVLAIGNPFGLGQTLTAGTVSMLGRSIQHEGRILRDLIQTDASINPGSSGGALVNSKGELVGVNTAIFTTTGSSIGIGFAIPVNQVKKVVPGLIHIWGKWIGWLLALLLVYWILRRIYRR